MNKLYRITKEEFEKRKILYKFSDTKYYVMDGKGINTYADYFDKLWETFGFSTVPKEWLKDYHTEDDFMTDSEEITANKVVFVIKNYDLFMQNNQNEKALFEKRYEKCILPFWDKEVERVEVDGKRKDFNIYLVSNE